eukprot:TRINITY_DN13521_c0_g1_i1.p1 TRINITY_DN13521_c0_g1~~TRINITY_DN13521_c0_g1_i1.p1  ORF type:complete len:251 (+),score=39.30 TRINITY_DN13521_c0_g1_i1:96-848(+)
MCIRDSYLDAPYQNQYPLLVPGGRIDLAVRCSAAASYSIVSQPTAPYHSDLEMNTVVFQGTLANLIVEGSPMTMSPPDKLPMRPSYLPDLRNTTVPVADQFNVMFHTTGGPFPAGPPYPPMFINGQPFSTKDDIVVNVSVGAPQEWTVSIDKDESSGSNHPFHLHVNPFQVVAIGGEQKSMLDITLGEWRDTIPVPHFYPLTIRYKPDRFLGHALMHCHMTPHVDLGMAAVAKIVAPGNASNVNLSLIHI